MSHIDKDACRLAQAKGLGGCRDENFPYVESIGYGQSHACKLLILRRGLLLSDSLLARLSYHEPAFDVRFVRGAAGTTSFFDHSGTYSVWLSVECVSASRSRPSLPKNLRGTLSRSWTGTRTLTDCPFRKFLRAERNANMDCRSTHRL
jgi:hypothetical protein